ncbi:S53 family peptidase [Nocardioides terrisoli]|uniref:S53 family peptidase n=1 Tax=Nocardioides terrisoli TaxID=3388267 RepID=UPI00287B9848|nr:S53 family peptidase [Nocardioides marmorisolisilvae]
MALPPRRSALAAALAATATAISLAAAPVATSAVAASSPASGGSGGFSPAISTGPHGRFVGLVDTTDPDTHFSCQDDAGCYSPAQMRAAYGFNKLDVDGTGRTIVIVDAFQSPTINQDLALFDQVFGLPDSTLNVIAPDGLTPFDDNDTNQVGWAGEITLDVEWAHAIAPGATIDLVLARSNNDADILSATRYAVDHDLGDVISQSFGEGETCMDPALVKAQHAVFRQAVSQDITLLASSGDQGAAQQNCTGPGYFKSASTPATDPYVTAVGGTRLVADSSGSYESEQAWDEVSTFGDAGGGFSTLYGTPRFQKKLHLPSRAVPDVAYNAGIDGGVLAVFSVPLGQPAFFRFGGTSAGSPQWAGLVADAAQMNGGRVGYLNDRLYAWGRGARLADRLFHDVTAGDNDFGSIAGYSAGPGWDAVTGLGSPKADALVPQLAQ